MGTNQAPRLRVGDPFHEPRGVTCRHSFAQTGKGEFAHVHSATLFLGLGLGEPDTAYFG
jgi:hypothetical protein